MFDESIEYSVKAFRFKEGFRLDEADQVLQEIFLIITGPCGSLPFMQDTCLVKAGLEHSSIEGSDVNSVQLFSCLFFGLYDPAWSGNLIDAVAKHQEEAFSYFLERLGKIKEYTGSSDGMTVYVTMDVNYNGNSKSLKKHSSFFHYRGNWYHADAYGKADADNKRKVLSGYVEEPPLISEIGEFSISYNSLLVKGEGDSMSESSSISISTTVGGHEKKGSDDEQELSIIANEDTKLMEIIKINLTAGTHRTESESSISVSTASLSSTPVHMDNNSGVNQPIFKFNNPQNISLLRKNINRALLSPIRECPLIIKDKNDLIGELWRFVEDKEVSFSEEKCNRLTFSKLEEDEVLLVKIELEPESTERKPHVVWYLLNKNISYYTECLAPISGRLHEQLINQLEEQRMRTMKRRGPGGIFCCVRHHTVQAGPDELLVVPQLSQH